MTIMLNLYIAINGKGLSSVTVTDTPNDPKSSGFYFGVSVIPLRKFYSPWSNYIFWIYGVSAGSGSFGVGRDKVKDWPRIIVISERGGSK